MKHHIVGSIKYAQKAKNSFCMVFSRQEQKSNVRVLRSLFQYMFLTLFTITLLVSCKKYVQIAPPTSRLITETVFKDPITATAAQTAIYSQMEKYSYSISQNVGLLSDELRNWSTQSIFIQEYTNSLQAINAPLFWKDIYAYIYQANSVINGLTNNSSISTTVVNQLMGEAKFIRAFWHFYLTNLYGDIPLVLTTDYKYISLLPRVSQVSVYNQIKNDLVEAKNLLQPIYVDGSSENTSSERVRPNKWVATALLARVYLFMGEYTNALNESTEIINNSALFSLKANLNDVFLKNSTEAIWQIQIPLPSSFNTTDGRYFILSGNPTTGANQNATIAAQLYSTFEAGDNRKTSWIKTNITGTGSYNFPYKYKVQAGSTKSEYTMVLRLAEQYLIRAEALARGNDITGAIANLNVIRNRAGLSNYTGAIDKISVISAILHEKQVELFTEWGHRWLDLKRSGTIDAVMGVVTPLKGGVWEPTDALLPIPQTEIGANPNLIQNQGY